MSIAISRARYLNLAMPVDWYAVLNDSLAFLRECWSSDWVGLPALLKICTDELVDSRHREEAHVAPLLACAAAVATDMERRASTSREPDYHNRLHTADALTALTVCLVIERERATAIDPYWASVMLLAMTAHDYLHPGGRNASAFELERLSASALARLSEPFAMDRAALTLVTSLIERTDPARVPENHALVRGRPFGFNLLWASVLLNEADILASCTAQHGPRLGRALGQEWSDHRLAGSHEIGTDRGREKYLRTVEFSSPASRALGIEAQIQGELRALAAARVPSPA
jgi:hypothetical protein